MQKNDVDSPPEAELEVGRDGLVAIHHHKQHLEARVLPKAVRGWMRQGWSTQKPAETPTETPAETPAETTTDKPAPGVVDGAPVSGEPADAKPALDAVAPSASAAGRAKSEAAPAAKSK